MADSWGFTDPYPYFFFYLNLTPTLMLNPNPSPIYWGALLPATLNLEPYRLSLILNPNPGLDPNRHS